MTGSLFVCPKCNAFVEGLPDENGKTPTPKCDQGHDTTEVQPFLRAFFGGMLFVCLGAGLMQTLALVSTVMASLFFAFFGLWPLAAAIAFFEAVRHSWRGGPVRKLAARSFGFALGMVCSVFPMGLYYLLFVRE